MDTYINSSYIYSKLTNKIEFLEKYNNDVIVSKLFNSNITCPVCDDICNFCTLSNCQHNLCYYCISQMLKQNKNINCPICRATILSEDDN